MPDDDQSTATQVPDEQSPAVPPPGEPAAPVVTRTTRSRARKTAPTAESTEPAESTATAEPAAEASTEATEAPAKKTAARKTAAKKAAPAKKTAAKKTTTRKTAAATNPAPVVELGSEADGADAEPTVEPVLETAPKTTAETQATAPTVTTTTRSRRTTKKAAAQLVAEPEPTAESTAAVDEAAAASGTMPLFQAPEKTTPPARRTRKTAAQRAAEAAETTESAEQEGDEPAVAEPAAAESSVVVTRRAPRKRGAARQPVADETPDETPGEIEDETTESAGDLPAVDETDATDETGEVDESADESGDDSGDEQSGEGGGRRRRRRGGRRRRKSGDSGDQDASDADGAESDDDTTGAESDDDAATGETGPDDTEAGGDGSSRRRRRRRRTGDSGGDDDHEGGSGASTTRTRRPRNAEDEITSVQGSTRLEAKKQRRREGREAGRRRAPIVSEAEFLARRESVERVMVVRQREELTQIGVLEDKVLVEHYVARESQTSLIGNVYLGRVQNVLPSMEAAFIDIGKGRNAVLYAGEVNWSALGHKDGQPRKIESVLSSGQTILVQVSKDPIGHKGARLTSQISLAGRFLVYVPDGTTSGISRKLPDTERNRLKTLLKEIVPETAGVIVRTAAEGASEDELTSDVERLKARWEDIEAKAEGSAPQLLYGEPDLTLKVVRDLFTEDFAKLVVQGPDAWDTVQGYVRHVAPDLEERLERYEPAEHSGVDLFATYRVEEQIAKGLDRKVWLPSGGSLIIDRTEAMTVVDVNTGKFTGSGGNLEETVTKNNLEAAEEMVRQLRLRDIGGIIVVDFIDMVLESNRDLVLRRLVECLGRDRTRHQVAEVTSLGLVQMTRKRIGTGLVEAFSENCTHCQGRGVVISDQPVEARGGVSGVDEEPRRTSRRRGGRGRNPGEDTDEGNGGGNGGSNGGGTRSSAPSPAIVATMVRPENAALPPVDGLGPVDDTPPAAEPVDQPAAQPVDEPADLPDTVEDTAPPTADEPVPAPSSELESVLDSVRSVESSEPVATPETEPTTEPAPAADAEGAGFPDEPEQSGEPEQPRVVTRARRRSASRPAGPPEGSVTPTSVTVDPDTLGEPVESAGDVPVVEHVPIKRKGTRKR